MRQFTVIALAMVWLPGCSQEPVVSNTEEEIPLQLPPNVVNDQLPSESAKLLIAESASIANDDFEKMLIVPDPTKIESQTLSVVLFSLNPFDYGDQSPAQNDFRYLTPELPKPSQIANVMWRSKKAGYATMIQPEYITQCECHTEAGLAQGHFFFEAPGVYSGRVEFSARHEGGQWFIHEFRLPNVGVKTTLSSDGIWSRSALGEIP